MAELVILLRFMTHSCEEPSLHLFQEVDTFQGLKGSFCLTLGNELSEEANVLTMQLTLRWEGAPGQRVVG